MEQSTTHANAYHSSNDSVALSPRRSRVTQALLPVGLSLLGLASVMGLPRFREDLQGWGFPLAALVFAGVFLGALELARRRRDALTANTAGALGVLLISALMWSVDKQLRTLVQFSPPIPLAESLSVMACAALLWFYRLPSLSGLLSIGLYMVASETLAQATQKGGEPWSSLQMWLPAWMGVLNLSAAACTDKLRPAWRSHASCLHLIGLVLIETGAWLAIQRQWIPLWGFFALQAILLAGMFWLRRHALVALLLVITTLFVFLVLGPMTMGTPMGWDLILAALGISLLLWYALWFLLRRRSAAGERASADPTTAAPPPPPGQANAA